MKGFTAVAFAVVGTSLVLLSYHDHDDDFQFSPSQNRKLHSMPRSFGEETNYLEPRDMAAPTLTELSTPMQEWGNPAKLTSFGYKWRDDKCDVVDAATNHYSFLRPKKKKKRAALCLYGGISKYTRQYSNSSSTPDISDLSNIDWAATLYDMNLLPEGDFELDLFIHSWSETYFCTIVRSYDGTRFNVRSIIAEPNDRHMKELIPQIKDQIKKRHWISPSLQPITSQQLSMYFSMNKVLAQALDYSNNHCGFEYDLLIAARPDVLLAEPISLHNNKDGTETRLHLALNPHSNMVLHSHIVNEWKGTHVRYGDFHYIFNAANARTFVEKMFPSPDQKWPEIAKLGYKIESHSGWVQRFAENNGITMSNDGIGPPHEEVARKIWNPNFIRNDQRLKYLQEWKQKLDFLGLPDHCFPSAPDGWRMHINSEDPSCFPKYYDAQESCPSNQKDSYLSTAL